jgi:uncharacterized protein YjbI with pentapeptide repeats
VTLRSVGRHGADMMGVDPNDENLIGAILTGVALEGAFLERGSLLKTQLDGAFLRANFLLDANPLGGPGSCRPKRRMRDRRPV